MQNHYLQFKIVCKNYCRPTINIPIKKLCSFGYDQSTACSSCCQFYQTFYDRTNLTRAVGIFKICI